MNTRMKSRTQKIIFSALLASFICVATMLIKIPMGGGGYVNLGDGVIILASVLLGGIYGGLASGVGSALADLFSGYAVYIPVTFIIKGLMATVAAIIYRKAKNRGIFSVIFASLAAEILMVAGYFLFEALILGYGLAAAATVLGNCMQGVAGIVTSTLLFVSLRKVFDFDNLIK